MLSTFLEKKNDAKELFLMVTQLIEFILSI